MLRISKKADYALMAMKHLAGEARDGTVTARSSADERCEQVPEVQRPGSTLACQEPHRRHAPVVQPF